MVNPRESVGVRVARVCVQMFYQCREARNGECVDYPIIKFNFHSLNPAESKLFPTGKKKKCCRTNSSMHTSHSGRTANACVTEFKCVT